MISKINSTTENKLIKQPRYKVVLDTAAKENIL